MEGRQRRMTLPSSPGREDPTWKPATKPCSDPHNSAAFIFVHGLGDTADGLEPVADQFQNNDKLSYMTWIIPNAKENREAMTTAWYRQASFQEYPDRPELEDQEDEEGMLETVKYLESLIDACVSNGIPAERIVLGGFSQGFAMSLLTDLISPKYSGKLAGILGLMGYLPLNKNNRLQDLRSKAGLPPVVGEVPVFLARGKADQLVPKRMWDKCIKGLEDMGLNRSAMTLQEYDGLGHALSGRLLMDMCNWLEKVLPKMED